MSSLVLDYNVTTLFGVGVLKCSFIYNIIVTINVKFLMKLLASLYWEKIKACQPYVSFPNVLEM